MLAPLDNGTIFKTAFRDKIVFKSFVKDILGIDIEVDKIETEKKFEPKIGNVDFTGTGWIYFTSPFIMPRIIK